MEKRHAAYKLGIETGILMLEIYRTKERWKWLSGQSAMSSSDHAFLEAMYGQVSNDMNADFQEGLNETLGIYKPRLPMQDIPSS
jgi:hypothetical protein